MYIYLPIFRMYNKQLVQPYFNKRNKIKLTNNEGDNMKSTIFIDTEVNKETNEAFDFGATNWSATKEIHTKNKEEFLQFISEHEYIVGHNIILHDIKYIYDSTSCPMDIIDTLPMSPLLFPKNPYHSLLKDDKLQTLELNNPLNDAIKCKNLFYDEVNEFKALNDNMKQIYYLLLHENESFCGFFKYCDMDFKKDNEHLVNIIREEFAGKICENAPFLQLIEKNAIALSYCLAIIKVDDNKSIIPPWVNISFPDVSYVMKTLVNTPCADGDNCKYCKTTFDVNAKLKEVFGYDSFRKYDGEPLQENAARAAVNNESLIAVFPTGGGKSITFQLPALVMGEASKGLTIVISPLQSLMKDQVDNLSNAGISKAVTINGMLNHIERSEVINQVKEGFANILYISPELLRSKVIERLLLGRNVVRFVIDEAHCLSSWGQDFRVDYLYIAEFIKNLQQKKKLDYKIPVSCFTATAKKQVIADISNYFKVNLDLDLKLFATKAARSNLNYKAINAGTDNQKYEILRNLIIDKKCPTIVYVSRTKKTRELAEKLVADGINATYFNGKMESSEKIANQDKFLQGEVDVIIATSAFGMGVDKKDVLLVVHFEISDSLENYVQEAGRAGRDENLNADCYILYNNEDLDKHFILLNQSKITLKEIQQVFRAIKQFAKVKNPFFRSPLEIARQAGFDDTVYDIETRIKTAISALETAGYVKRGKNSPRIFATSIRVKNMIEASDYIEKAENFTDIQKDYSRRILSQLISKKSRTSKETDQAETRIDYISDTLGIPKMDVINCINLMREEGLLSNENDMIAYIKQSVTKRISQNVLDNYFEVENFLLSILEPDSNVINLKKINDQMIEAKIKKTSIKMIKTLLHFWTIKNYIKRDVAVWGSSLKFTLNFEINQFKKVIEKREKITNCIIEHFYNKALDVPIFNNDTKQIEFSLLEIKEQCIKTFPEEKIETEDIESALLYASKIEAINIEGGFLVLYNTMELKALESGNVTYKINDYKDLSNFYKQKTQQIHIVGEYAELLIKDPQKSFQFVDDYFHVESKEFLNTYFEGDRLEQIKSNITPQKHAQLFGSLSNAQLEIIRDDTSKYITVLAGPGSGKTRVLVHKLASLLLLEDVKHEQLLMLTFSRAAVMEFKNRLQALIGNAAYFVEIKTFHSYCFDLLGKIGNLSASDNVIKEATEKINDNEVEIGRITKSVIVIDEAQDMDKHEADFVKTLIEQNEDMRVIFVGDDDQNIYGFRGADNKYFKAFIEDNNAKVYNLLTNYRSDKNIVSFSNEFLQNIKNRLKTDEITPISNEVGSVRLVKHQNDFFEDAIALEIKNSNQKGVAVLTNSNKEAFRIERLLTKKGIKAKLIQSIDDRIKICDLVEIRQFIKYIEAKLESPIVSDKLYLEAVNYIKKEFETSDILEMCLTLFRNFEDTYAKKYKTDLDMFIYESKMEDMYSVSDVEVFVSTIHKSKGREFDNVYLLLNNVILNDDESLRKLYVGMTRAKKSLNIHYRNMPLLDYDFSNVTRVTDNNVYTKCDEIMLQLTLRNVRLGGFKFEKDKFFNVKSGKQLQIRNDSLTIAGQNVIINYSLGFKNYLNTLKKDGYVPAYATVGYNVFWKCLDDNVDYPVLLPMLILKEEQKNKF